MAQQQQQLGMPVAQQQQQLVQPATTLSGSPSRRGPPLAEGNHRQCSYGPSMAQQLRLDRRLVAKSVGLNVKIKLQGRVGGGEGVDVPRRSHVCRRGLGLV